MPGVAAAPPEVAAVTTAVVVGRLAVHGVPAADEAALAALALPAEARKDELEALKNIALPRSAEPPMLPLAAAMDAAAEEELDDGTRPWEGDKKDA